jgi:hypothetical protein
VVGVSLAVLLPLILYADRFIAAEKTLYQADHVAYWSFCVGLAQGLTGQPVAAVAAIADSVAHQELNLLPATPVALAMTVLGPSRLAYVASILLVYGLLVIAALVLALWALRFQPTPPDVPTLIVAAAWAILMVPALWYPVFRGYIGLGGVAIGLAVLALYLRRPPVDTELKDLLVLGFLVGLLALFRRWYSFWSVAFCGVVALESVWCAWAARGRRRVVWRCFRPPVVVGSSAVATLAVLAAPVALRRLGAGYSEEFVSYSSTTGIAGLVSPAVFQFGALTLAAVVAAIVWLMRSGRRRVAAVIVLQLMLAFGMMAVVQDHGPQHWHLYAPGMLLLLGLAACGLLSGMGSSARRRVVALMLCAAGMMVTAVVMVPGATATGAVDAVLPGLRLRPVVRQDLAEVRRLLEYLDDVAAVRPGFFYVLGSSAVFSDQALAFANMSLEEDFVSTSLILQGAHVDRRDGFPRGLLEADYVVVADPPQVHLGRSHQQVVVIPSESFASGTDVAAAFRKLPAEFDLDAGLRVSVYRKTRPILESEIAEMSDRLRALYPDRPDIYKP